MGVIVVVPGRDDPWMVSNDGFRMLTEIATELTEDRAVTCVLASAADHHSLLFDHLDQPLRARVALVLACAADALGDRLRAGQQVDDRSRSFAERLPTLATWLDGLVEDATSPCRGG